MLIAGTARLDDLLDGVVRTFCGNLAWCMEYDAETEAFVSGRIYGAKAEAFHTRIFGGFADAAHNPWLRAGMRRAPWSMIRAADLPAWRDPQVPPEFAAFVGGLGLHEHLAVILSPPPRQLVFAVFREQERPYVRREVIDFETLAGGLRSLMTLGRDHPAALHGLSQAELTRRTVQPRLLVDGELRIVDANRAGELLLAKRKPIGQTASGRLDLRACRHRGLADAIERARRDIRAWTPTAPAPVNTPEGIVNITTCGGGSPRLVLDIRENWPYDEALIELYTDHLVGQDGWPLRGDARLTAIAVLQARYGAEREQILGFLGSGSSGGAKPGIGWGLREKIAAIHARAGADRHQLASLIDRYLDR